MSVRIATNLDAARDLAELGFEVFPPRPRSKAPLTPHGFKDASRDERTILHWYDRWPGAGVAIACGAVLAVVDADVKAGADPKEVLDLHGLTDAPMVVETAPNDEGERGRHVYCRGPARTGKTAEVGVEIRGRGSYCVCPPSIHPTGIAYRWRNGPVAVERLPELPEGLRPVAAPPWVVTPNAMPIVSIEDLATEGYRHDALKWHAIGLIRRGILDPATLLAELLAANASRCHPPKSDAEVVAIVRWALRSDAAAAEIAWIKSFAD
jgi:Bifunctional DNA primase/polymerase, N-terminal